MLPVVVLPLVVKITYRALGNYYVIDVIWAAECNYVAEQCAIYVIFCKNCTTYDATVTALATNQIFASFITEVLWDVVYHLCCEGSVSFCHDLPKTVNALSVVRIGSARNIKISQCEVESATKWHTL